MKQNRMKVYTKGDEQYDSQSDFDDDMDDTTDTFRGNNKASTMVMVKSAGKGDRPSPMENVPKLPPISGATPSIQYSYSENPYEIDLSFRSLDYLAFNDPRRGKFFFL